jgi:hypothetical protein
MEMFRGADACLAHNADFEHDDSGLTTGVQLTSDGHKPYLEAVEVPSAPTSTTPCS